MAKTQETKRATGSQREIITIKLSQISENRELYGHRKASDYFDDKALSGLIASVRSEDMLVPMIVGETDRPGEFVLVGGYRRKGVLKKLIETNADTTRYYPDMPVEVIVIRKGNEQSQGEYEMDLFVASGTDNEVREAFDDAARLHFVQGAIERKLDDDRGMLTLGIEATQWKRLKGVATRDWLLKAVTNKQLKLSHATMIVEALRKAQKANRANESLVEEGIAIWIAAREQELAQERVVAKAINKPLSGSQDMVAKYVTSSLQSEWRRCIETGKPLIDKPSFHFGVAIKDGRLIVPAINLKVSDMTAAHWTALVRGLCEGVSVAAKPMEKAKRDEEQEQAVDVDAIFAQFSREAVERSKAEAGREPVNPQQAPKPVQSEIAAEVDDFVEAEDESEDEDSSTVESEES